MRPLLYVGCPATERTDTEKALAVASLGVTWVDTTSHALAELQRRDAPVIIDLARGASALQVARDLRHARAATLMFAVVDSRRPDLTTEAILTGMADVFARPLGGRRVASAIDRELAFEARRPGGNGKGAISSDDLYCHSPAMRDVMALIARAATMRAGVMVRGEEGTGRQVVARAVHAARPEPGPFVVVDCSEFEPEQLEIELFGNAMKSSLAVDSAARGLERLSSNSWVYRAAGGTLYLQGVAEASARVQARLARVLRDREAVLVESNEPIVLEVRPIISADAAIDTAVQEGRIRDDLFRRLSVIRIDVPPLRSRREDIPALANFFLREVCAAGGVPAKTLSRPALSLISALPWRGNATELRALLEHVVGGAAGRGIALEDVLAHVKLDGGAVVFAAGGTLRQARARFEREYIAAVLEAHHGRISEAARALGIQRTNLYRKMRSLKVTRKAAARG